MQHRPSAAKRGVAGEGQFTVGGEDSQAVVGAGIGRSQYEGGLRQIRPACNSLHGRGAQCIGIEDDRDRVTEEGAVGEDIKLQKGKGATHASGLCEVVLP